MAAGNEGECLDSSGRLLRGEDGTDESFISLNM